jgi:predicted transcriptional regulator
MPAKQPTLSPAEEDGQTDSAVLALLLYGDSQRPWSVDEIEREIGRDTDDSLARLYGAGLIHRLKRFVWPTRAAVMADEISE